MPKRKPIPGKIRVKIRKKNLEVCCVCKERGIGINFRHIDGNPANNTEENIALLCVQNHDQLLYIFIRKLTACFFNNQNYKDQYFSKHA